MRSGPEVFVSGKTDISAGKAIVGKQIPQTPARIHRVVLYNLFKALLAVRILKEVDISGGDKTLPNRTLVVVREAARRGVPVQSLKFLGKESTNFSPLTLKHKNIFLKFCPGGHSRNFKIDFDDKYKLKKILKSDNLPRAEGECFYSAKKALAYGKKLGFPFGG